MFPVPIVFPLLARASHQTRARKPIYTCGQCKVVPVYAWRTASRYPVPVGSVVRGFVHHTLPEEAAIGTHRGSPASQV
ncbi:hypothetical protein E2C01_034031 [Portunus trituberculatus]|uniref:Uncharacterized protein n=1 Tax=Portunus trituberculatus TaxID=210409 RepID=A0A5B7F1Q8_PORTR|nr:hypothetical protein [Portunus trituberculatus]